MSIFKKVKPLQLLSSAQRNRLLAWRAIVAVPPFQFSLVADITSPRVCRSHHSDGKEGKNSNVFGENHVEYNRLAECFSA
jgi:hypothetical protein